VELPSENDGSIVLKYSVGVGGMSFGQFDERERATEVIKEIAGFLCGDAMEYTVPANEPVTKTKK